MTQERCGERIFESSLMIASSDISEGVDGWHICTVTGIAHFGNRKLDLHNLALYLTTSCLPRQAASVV